MIVLVQCRDRVGLVAAVTGVLAAEKLNIVSLREHVDKVINRFFIRVEVEQEGNGILLENQLQAVLPEGALITVNPSPQKKIVVLRGKK
jgi:formyltetrahydrofolate deformylase